MPEEVPQQSILQQTPPNKKVSFKFFFLCFLTILLGGILGFVVFLGTVFIAVGLTWSDVPYKPNLFQYLLISFIYILPTITFFTPLTILLLKNFKKSRVLLSMLIVIVITSISFYLISTYSQSVQNQKATNAANQDSSLLNQGVNMHVPGGYIYDKDWVNDGPPGQHSPSTKNKQGILGFPSFETDSHYLGKKVSFWSFNYLSPKDTLDCTNYKDYPPFHFDSNIYNNCVDVMVGNKPAVYRSSNDGVYIYIMFDENKTRITIEFKSEDSNNKLTKEDILNIAAKVG
ncbi:MAG TPA: hypothetical protein VLE47_02980 [Candidatus Saccharimonadales bacterium]|nr:hypothetical protein [Candidatus Saccharimonadales bacterium]